MKKEYYKNILGEYYNSGSKWGDYIVYGLDESESEFEYDSLDYTDIYNQVVKYYNVKTEEESEEQRAIRLAKEKAEKRNSKIDQILGE